MDISDFPCFECNRKMQIVYCNMAFADMTGFTLREIMRKGWDLFIPRSNDQFLANQNCIFEAFQDLDQAMRECSLRQIATKYSSYRLVMQTNRLSSAHMHIELSFSPKRDSILGKMRPSESALDTAIGLDMHHMINERISSLRGSLGIALEELLRMKEDMTASERNRSLHSASTQLNHAARVLNGATKMKASLNAKFALFGFIRSLKLACSHKHHQMKHTADLTLNHAFTSEELCGRYLKADPAGAIGIICSFILSFDKSVLITMWCREDTVCVVICEKESADDIKMPSNDLFCMLKRDGCSQSSRRLAKKVEVLSRKRTTHANIDVLKLNQEGAVEIRVALEPISIVATNSRVSVW